MSLVFNDKIGLHVQIMGIGSRRLLNYLRVRQRLSYVRRLESELGCRYSSLVELFYFDAPRILVIDPMHCLFLGLVKHFVKRVFIGKGILFVTDFALIQRRVSALSVPPDIGRIPQNIKHTFYSFTADQYKNWVFHYLFTWNFIIRTFRVLETSGTSRQVPLPIYFKA